MGKEQRGRIFQDNTFEFSEFNGLKLETLLVCENPVNKEPLIVFLKVENNNWHQFFLDAGIAFWENWDGPDTTDEYYDYVDYTDKFGLRDKRIVTIHCEPDGANCRIIVEFENNEKLLLHTKEPDVFDSESELLKT